MPSTPYVVLTRHFLSMLFRSSGGTAVRALAAVAAPMLLASFWIVNLAHDLSPWAAAGIHYMFVLYSFCSMGCVTALQWQRLFPDRTDFLVLLPLPLQPRVLFLARLSATAAYLGLFLLAANIFATVLLPALEPEHIVRAIAAHALATLAAGCAGCLLVLALEGAVIVLAPAGWSTWITTALQTLLVAALLTLFLRVLSVGDQLHALLGGSMHAVRWFMPLWFTATYEVHLRGSTATGVAYGLQRLAVWCVPVLLTAVAVTYPAAWLRQRRAALEGTRSAHLRDAVWSAPAHAMVLQAADRRAVLHFVHKTLMRQKRYHVLLAVYAGAGLALAVAAAVTVSSSHGRLHLSLWPAGVQAVMSILVFWTVAGLHVAFSLPDDLPSRWIFRVAPLQTSRVVTVTKGYVAMLCGLLLALTAALLLVCRWPLAAVAFLLMVNGAYAVLLTDAFFFLQSSIPFTRPAVTERTNLPLTLAVFLFGLPLSVLLLWTLEQWVGLSVPRLAVMLLASAILHGLAHLLRRLPSHPVSADAFLGESDGEVQTLNLSA